MCLWIKKEITMCYGLEKGWRNGDAFVLREKQILS